MKPKSVECGGHKPVIASLLAFALLLAPAIAGSAQNPSSGVAIRATDRKTVAVLESRAKAYVKLRNRIERKLPKLSKDSTPEQISAYKKAFEAGVRSARAGAKPGDIFTAGTAEYLRRLIRTEFKGQDRGELKETILEAETAGIPLKVNYPYPESMEVSTVPPTLLLKLPQLPMELNFRFTGRHMLLVDKENGLILDYLLSALP